MSYELFIARRHLVPKRGRGFLSLITWISVGGISLGTLALIVILAVMNGFETEVKTRIVGTNAHVLILGYGSEGIGPVDSLSQRIKENPEVVAVAPFVYGKALVSSRWGSDGIVVKGVDLEAEALVTDVPKYIKSLDGPLSLAARDGELPGIVLGSHIADNLRVTLGERVQILTPHTGAVSPLGYVPKVRNYRVAGIFKSGMYEYDSSLAFIAIPEAQSFFSLGDRVSALSIRVRDMYRAPLVGEAILAHLGGFPYRTTDWIDMNSNLFSWMQTEKRVMFVILALIVLVAAFNITSTLIMLVMEKRREIGILRSMGATQAEVARIFVWEGIVIGGVGMVLGGSGGLLLCYLLERYKFIKLPGDVYFIDTLPVRVQALDVVAILGAVLVISIVSTIYPAWRASRQDPVESIRQ
ncbi:MAG: lipoprotein-releasing ABC transporter permease subunit [Candidatus Eisenbacteria bacterium]|nr:lipoprotein-releasing ABC transporter permease subunit [Candidatus Eisenbacteria bacterium]MCC7141257.1 lipoprotein-releasing ABC transporter permease subunit [Candidatus Eisenbacteria bacterium]